jgi:hypothetical protein
VEAGGLGAGFWVGGVGGGVHAFVFVGAGAAFATAGVTRVAFARAVAFVDELDRAAVEAGPVAFAAAFAELVGRGAVDVVGWGVAAVPEVGDEVSEVEDGSVVDVLVTAAAAG